MDLRAIHIQQDTHARRRRFLQQPWEPRLTFLSRITAVGVGYHLDVVAFNIAGKKDPDAKVSIAVELNVEDGGVIE